MPRPWDRKSAAVEAAKPAATHSLVASAVQIQYNDLLSWRIYQFGRDEVWQRELWRLYDVVGELRFAANWVGSMMSRVRIYVAEIDENDKIGPETSDPEIQALANNMLGGPTAKAESLRLMGIDLTVCGEFYIVGYAARSANADDQWYIVVPSELSRWQAGVFYNSVDGPIQLLDNTDMIVRVWTPHPQRVWLADSPAHGAMNVIVELERLTKYIFSQIDSRLIGGGLLPIPAGIDFPDEDDEMGAADTLMAKLAQAGQASLRGEGSAAGVLPVIIEVPPETLGKLNLVSFDTGLSEQAMSLRKEAIERFAYSMDFPPEIMTGLGASNHWSAWYIDENAVKVHIEPPMTRICDALTKATLIPSLKKLGKDPKRYCYWFDTSGLTIRATRLEDAVALYKEGLLSGEAVREAGYFREDQAMSDEEAAANFGRLVAVQDPQLLSDKDFRKMIHIDKYISDDSEIGTKPMIGPPPPPPPAKVGTIDTRQPTPDRSPVPPGQQKTPVTVTSAAGAAELVLMSTANAAVIRALEVAGGRLITRQNRFPDVPKMEIHTRMRIVGSERTAELLAGAWQSLPALMEYVDVDIEELTSVLHEYTSTLLWSGQPHRPDAMVDALRRRGLISE